VLVAGLYTRHVRVPAGTSLAHLYLQVDGYSREYLVPSRQPSVARGDCSRRFNVGSAVTRPAVLVTDVFFAVTISIDR
jgi:hypothetical protein